MSLFPSSFSLFQIIIILLALFPVSSPRCLLLAFFVGGREGGREGELVHLQNSLTFFVGFLLETCAFDLWDTGGKIKQEEGKGRYRYAAL